MVETGETCTMQLEQLLKANREQKERLEKMERQMIPLLNSIRQQLGKRPVIVPKEKA